jgi:Rha family phage regulatory protein
MLQTLEFNQFVFSSNDDIKTTSLIIAEKFGKSHTHVIRDIEKIMTQVSDIFNKTNFGLIQVDVKVGFGTRKDKGYELTKDGFIMVVMSYTGAKAFAIKEAYIHAFNFMWNQLYGADHKFRTQLEAASTSFLITEAEKMNKVPFMSYFKLLNSYGYIFKRGKSKWMPSKKGIESGVVELKIVNPDYPGQLHLTAKGLAYLTDVTLLA